MQITFKITYTTWIEIALNYIQFQCLWWNCCLRHSTSTINYKPIHPNSFEEKKEKENREKKNPLWHFNTLVIMKNHLVQFQLVFHSSKESSWHYSNSFDLTFVNPSDDHYSFSLFNIGKLCSLLCAYFFPNGMKIVYFIYFTFFIIIHWIKRKLDFSKMNTILNQKFKLKDQFKHHRCHEVLHRCHEDHRQHQHDHHQCRAGLPNNKVFAVPDLKWQILYSKKTQIPMIITMSYELNAFECNNIDNRVSLIFERSFYE